MQQRRLRAYVETAAATGEAASLVGGWQDLRWALAALAVDGRAAEVGGGPVAADTAQGDDDALLLDELADKEVTARSTCFTRS